MDIFSLISPEENSQGEDGDAIEQFEVSSDGFETPRSSEWSTPRSLFTPPRSPPKTPPRPTSHVDERIRMRRYKLSMSPSRSPFSSGGGNMLSESSQDSPLRHRTVDNIFLSSNGVDEDEECWSSPNITPNSSPRKNDLLSLSPLQERLSRARTKRQQILEERAQHIDNKAREKEQLAWKLKEDATLEKVSKARTEDAIIQARAKREQINEERVQQIEVKTKLREEAIKRKEDVTLEIIEKARTELAKSPIVKERRDQQLALRVQSVEATLESKTALAQRRLERHLLEKQQRASCKERKELAERRRKLISYEKRAKLLAGLDAKLERAALKSHKFTEEKRHKAGEDIVKAKDVSRRVKAARVIQVAVREAYGIEIPDGGTLDLGHHDAALRLQTWFRWRAQVCKRRLFAGDENDPNAVDALKKLLILFPVALKGKQNRRPSMTRPFEQISQIMMQPETLKMAAIIASCLRPINEHSFGSLDESVASNTSSSKSCPTMDGRILLSLCLISVYPREVLGDEYEKTTSDTEEDDRSNRGSRLLASSCRALLMLLNEFIRVTSGKEKSRILSQISSVSLKAISLFQWWKNADMEQLLAGLRKQLVQSWVVYLTSSETLKYLAKVTGVETVSKGSSKKDDPLLSLRLRHEAGQSGSRSHIKRIRRSLNRLIGADEGKEVVKKAKMTALEDIDETNALKDLKGEIDEIYGLGHRSEDSTASTDVNGTSQDSGELPMSVDLPDEITSNRMLVHKILLTDPDDFGTLSWDGMNAQAPTIPPEEFMSSFNTNTVPSSNADVQSLEDMPMQVAKSMRMAFFNGIANDLEHGHFESVKNLLRELHSNMRALLPSRKDLHSHINDEDISSFSSTSDVFRVLLRSGYLLASYLESPARAQTTRDLIDSIGSFNSLRRDTSAKTAVPYGIGSEEMLVTASIAYILHKTELCKMDISNYKLSQVAPILHMVGHDYERKHFKETHGDYGSSTIAELQRMLPSTWNWAKKMQSLYGGSENMSSHSNFEQQMDFVKGKGFVDGILFTRSQLSLPEFLSLDVESINHIRSEARCCVIASALSLHACNISKVGTSVVGSTDMTDQSINEARDALSSALRKKYFEQTELECGVIEAIGTLTKALARRDLTQEELVALDNHTKAVLRGNDPVLKLLDNRVQSFFRFACKWKSEVAPTGSTAPLEMKTGRSVLKTNGGATSMRQGAKSTKKDFLLAAKKEASRLGFTYFGSELIEVGNEARKIVSLACMNYGKEVFGKLLSAAMEGN